MAAPGKLHILLTIDILSPFPSTPQIKEVQIDNARDSYSNNSNIVITTIPIQTVKILKIHKPTFYYSNQNKLKRWLY